jgi:hypothetical protein
VSKTHVLLAEDGLPIYDSRVAVAIAVLAERYGRETGLRVLPEALRFPTFDAKRHVAAVIEEPLGAARGYYMSATCCRDWTAAQWRLGRLIRRTLTQNSALFAGEGELPARCHAFEAGLFMLGYDASCLLG